jgi:hypothetical protein
VSLENATIVTADFPASVGAEVPSTPPVTPAVPESEKPAPARDESGKFVSPTMVPAGPADISGEPAPTPEGDTPATDATPPAGDDAPVQDAATDATPKVKKGSPQERINQAIAKQRQAERERDDFRIRAERAQALEAELAAMRSGTPPAPSPIDANAEPTEDQFEDYGSYIRALATYQARITFQQVREAERTRAAEEQAKRDEQNVDAEHAQRVARGQAKHDDFAEVVNRDIPVSAPMEDMIKHSDLGDEIMYHLGTHPEVAARIVALPPGKALVAMGELQATIRVSLREPAAGTGAAPRVPISRTPPPITPVGGGSHVSARSYEDMTPLEYIHARETELAAKSRPY